MRKPDAAQFRVGSVPAGWALRIKVAGVGGGRGSFYHHRIIRLFLKKIFVVFEILCSFHSNFFFFFAL
jgi:hypothetical protein